MFVSFILLIIESHQSLSMYLVPFITHTLISKTLTSDLQPVGVETKLSQGATVTVTFSNIRKPAYESQPTSLSPISSVLSPPRLPLTHPCLAPSCPLNLNFSNSHHLRLCPTKPWGLFISPSKHRILPQGRRGSLPLGKRSTWGGDI